LGVLSISEYKQCPIVAHKCSLFAFDKIVVWTEKVDTRYRIFSFLVNFFIKVEIMYALFRSLEGRGRVLEWEIYRKMEKFFTFFE